MNYRVVNGEMVFLDTEKAHGTRTRYVKGHCHCEECRKANARYQADYRRRKSA